MDNSQSSQKDKALRINSIRKYLQLSRGEFAKTFGIAKGTLQHWENPSDESGLTERGALRLQQALSAYGVKVSISWLMSGKGADPELPQSLNVFDRTSMTLSNSKEKKYIKEELNLFQSHYKNSVSLIVNDEKMLPLYEVGDVVAGIKLFDLHIQTIVGKICIVMTRGGKLLLRLVNNSSIPLQYQLTCINSYDDQTIDELKFAAPVIFLRKVAIQMTENR